MRTVCKLNYIITFYFINYRLNRMYILKLKNNFFKSKSIISLNAVLIREYFIKKSDFETCYFLTKKSINLNVLTLW